MSKQSKHERIIREEIEVARSELRKAEADVQRRLAVICALEVVIARADDDKGGDDA